MRTYHVTLFSPAGESEIITGTIDLRDTITAYAVADGKIYEYSQNLETSEVCITTYNKKGEVVSSKSIPKVSAFFKNEPDSYLNSFTAMGDYFEFNIRYEMPRQKCVLYDMANDKAFLMDETMFSIFSHDSGPNRVQTLITNAMEVDDAQKDFFFMDEAGSIKKIADGLDDSFSSAIGNDVVVFIKDEKMYQVSPYA